MQFGEHEATDHPVACEQRTSLLLWLLLLLYFHLCCSRRWWLLPPSATHLCCCPACPALLMSGVRCRSLTELLPSPHLSCPGVLALPSDYEGDLAAGFAALWRMPALPPLMQAGAMESTAVLRHYVLVHDASSAAPAVAAAAAERARAAAAALGAPCHLLTINSGSGSGAPVAPRLWADALHACVAGGGAGEPAERPPPPPAGLGAWLSEGDISGLAAFVHELAVRGVISHMEARLRALNAQVGSRAGRRAGNCAMGLAPGCAASDGCSSGERQATSAGCHRLFAWLAHLTVLPCCPAGHRQPQGPEEPAEEPAVAQGRPCVRRRQRQPCHLCTWHTLCGGSGRQRGQPGSGVVHARQRGGGDAAAV